MGEDRSAWVTADPARLEELVDAIRSLDAEGATDDEIAQWLKSRTVSFGDSGEALATARGLRTADAYGALHATKVWKASATRFHIVTASGPLVRGFSSPDGRTFGVGDTLNLPNLPELPHNPEPGRGTLWRVTAVEPDYEPGFTACLVVQPVFRLKPEA
jgi:hypothetical protein